MAALRSETRQDRYRDEERETRREWLLNLLEEPGWQVVRDVLARRVNAAMLAALRPGMTLEKLAEYRAEVVILREMVEDPARFFQEEE